jgi:acetyl/propionyl-CoA carboxylase alpha subunit
MKRALQETVITGISQTVPFHRAIMADPEFRKGDVHTGFIPQFMERSIETLDRHDREEREAGQDERLARGAAR